MEQQATNEIKIYFMCWCSTMENQLTAFEPNLEAFKPTFVMEVSMFKSIIYTIKTAIWNYIAQGARSARTYRELVTIVMNQLTDPKTGMLRIYHREPLLASGRRTAFVCHANKLLTAGSAGMESNSLIIP